MPIVDLILYGVGGAVRPSAPPWGRSSSLGVGTTYEDFDALLTPELAANRVGVSKQLLNYWRSTGKLPVVKRCGGQPLYRLRDLLAAESAARSVPRRRRARLIPAD